MNRLEAQQAAAEADELMKPPDALLRDGNEVISGFEPNDVTPARDQMLSAMENRDRPAEARARSFARPPSRRVSQPAGSS
jgi:hypothetical protein